MAQQWGAKSKAKRSGEASVPEVSQPNTDEIIHHAKSIFVPSTDLTIDDGLKLAVYSLSKQGKTHLTQAGTPVPRYCIDTENNIKKEILNRKKHTKEEADQTFVAEVMKESEIVEKKGKYEIDLVASLNAAFDAMDFITDIVKNTPHAKGTPAPGTIIVDSCTDIWDWTKTWLEEGADGKLKRNKTTGEIPRFEWGKANQKYTNFIHMLLHSNWHVILTFRAKPAVNEKGEDLGKLTPDWQKYTDFWLDVITEVRWNGQTSELIFRGDRYGNITGKIVDPTWSKICAAIEESSGIKIL